MASWQWQGGNGRVAVTVAKVAGWQWEGGRVAVAVARVAVGKRGQ
jgi:hypothetical protein